MRAGMLRDVVLFLRPEISETAFSGKKSSYVEHLRTRAQVIHNSGSKKIDSGEVFTSYTVRFIIRHYHGITTGMVICHEGVKYRILDINPQRSQKRIVITGEIIND